jgi:hypothetical protein
VLQALSGRFLDGFDVDRYRWMGEFADQMTGNIVGISRTAEIQK